MKKAYPCLLLLVCLIQINKAQSQSSELAIGQWKSHLPFNNGNYVTQSDDKIYYATRYAVLEVDKEERSVRRMTKVEGLSDVGVSLVKYNKEGKSLLVIYNDSKVDIINEEGVLTLPAISNAPFLGAKTVYDVFMESDSIAYLAANYGITTLNLKRGIFPNTIKTPVAVHSVRPFNGLLYAATDDGLYVTDPNGNENINDFSTWDWLNGTSGLPLEFRSDAMTLHNGQLYLDVNDSLFVFDGNTATNLMHSD
ncbi:MAG: hypothetical protein IT258_23390, partial [Saprospiraceae bacterium]|nr:hypothetical protein [Saprospiraceae bacterium]